MEIIAALKELGVSDTVLESLSGVDRFERTFTRVTDELEIQQTIDTQEAIILSPDPISFNTGRVSLRTQ